MDRDPIRAEIQAVYEDVGRSGARAPAGLGLPTGAALARALGYRKEDLAQVPGDVQDAFVGAAALASEVSGDASALVLDLGCGAGLDSWLLARRGHRVVALDLSAAMLGRLARARTPGGGSVLAARALLPHIPVRSRGAGWVLLNGVANLVPEQGALLEEVRRVLAPGGTLLIADLLAVDPLPEELRRLPEAWAWCVAGARSAEEWEEALTARGFEGVRVTVLEELPPCARALIRAHASGAGLRPGAPDLPCWDIPANPRSAT